MVDITIIVVYFVIVLGAGFWVQKRASQNLESYFLGSHNLPWWALAMSGSASNFSVMGTMWMCTVLYTLGMKSFWIHWMWAFPHGAILLAFMAVWIRRTRVMTAAELLKFRFATGRGAVFARTVFAILAVLIHAGTIGMAYVAVYKFIIVYLPKLDISVSPEIVPVVVTLLTASYTLVGGFRSVIITDVLQTGLLIIVGVILGTMAYNLINPADVQANFPGLNEWTSLKMPWHSNIETYEAFGPISLNYVLIGFLICIGGAGGHYGEQRFLATRNTADASKAAAGWAFLAIPRWFMVAGIVLLAMAAFPKSEVTDVEQIMPLVLSRFMKTGLWGLVLSGLIAAYMSTVSSLINSGASMLVRDIWQPLFTYGASERHLVNSSYVATALVVIIGMIIGAISLRFSSIDGLWRWLMAGLGASILVPNALRWYWWRMNGWGFAAGCLSGFVVSILMLITDIPQYYLSPVLIMVSLFGCVIGSLLTEPVAEEYVGEFYRRVRPFGIWGHFKKQLSPEQRKSLSPLGTSLIVFNVAVAFLAIVGFYVFPIYVVGHWHLYAAVSLSLALLSSVMLYFTWYRRLAPEKEEFVNNAEANRTLVRAMRNPRHL